MFTTATKEKNTGSAATAGLGTNEKENLQTTVVAKGTVIEGKFASAENVRLDGTVIGEVSLEKRLVMGVGSLVQGNIEARDAVIKGKVEGDIRVREALQLMDTAVIEGNIFAKTLLVDEGAQYNGACQIGG